MTHTEINRAIAESLGWKPTTDSGWCMGPDGEPIITPPNYHGDLNAIQEAVLTLVDLHAFLRELQIVTEKFTSVDADWDDEWLWYSVNATAPQRCEAYLKTIGKWRDQ